VLNSSRNSESRGCNPKALWLPAEKRKRRRPTGASFLSWTGGFDSLHPLRGFSSPCLARSFPPAERGHTRISRSGHENLYRWHDYEQRSSSRASEAISYSQLTARLQSLAQLRGSSGARAHNLVEARLLLREVVLAVNFIFHHVWRACVQLSRARILDGTSRRRKPFMNSGAYQPVLAG
jgi:hypothetical protein